MFISVRNCSAKRTMLTFLAAWVDMEAMSNLTFFTISSNRLHYLKSLGSTHTFWPMHPLTNTHEDCMRLNCQQVWGPGWLSKDVKSTEDSLMLFPYLWKQRHRNLEDAYLHASDCKDRCLLNSILNCTPTYCAYRLKRGLFLMLKANKGRSQKLLAQKTHRWNDGDWPLHLHLLLITF